MLACSPLGRHYLEIREDVLIPQPLPQARQLVDILLADNGTDSQGIFLGWIAGQFQVLQGLLNLNIRPFVPRQGVLKALVKGIHFEYCPDAVTEQLLRNRKRDIRAVGEQLYLHIQRFYEADHLHNMRIQHRFAAQDNYFPRPQIPGLLDDVNKLILGKFIRAFGAVQGIAVDTFEIAALVELNLHGQQPAITDRSADLFRGKFGAINSINTGFHRLLLSSQKRVNLRGLPAYTLLLTCSSLTITTSGRTRKWA